MDLIVQMDLEHHHHHHLLVMKPQLVTPWSTPASQLKRWRMVVGGGVRKQLIDEVEEPRESLFHCSEKSDSRRRPSRPFFNFISFQFNSIQFTI